MKAIVYTQYGPADVLHLQEVEKPTPKDNEVLIKVHATSVTAGDCNARGFVFVPPGFGFMARLVFGLRKPRQPILGVELSGEIVEVGKDVRLFKKGDQVFGISEKYGAYAEYICMAEDASLVMKPANLTCAEAASIPFGANTALYFLRDMAKLQPGQKVLIIGASGCTGVYASSSPNTMGLKLPACAVRGTWRWCDSLGQTMSSTTRKKISPRTARRMMLFWIWSQASLRLRAINPPSSQTGCIWPGQVVLESFAQMAWTALTGGKKVIAGMAPDRVEDLVFLKELLEAGKLKPVIDRRYPLEQTAEAHRYADTGHKRGSVVITIAA